MKKTVTVILALVLLLSLCVMPASAKTEKSEWDKMTGPGEISFSDEGVNITFSEGLTFYKYTKAPVNVKDFTCRFKVREENYLSAYYSITLMNGKAYGGKQGLFLLLRIKDDNIMNVEGQIINTGLKLTDPDNVNITVDCTKEMVLKGKDNGDGTYTISFEGGVGEYTFNIPENFKFTEDLNGEGYLTIGGFSHDDGLSRTLTVISYNDVDFTGSKPKESDSSNGSGSADTSDSEGGIIIGDDTSEGEISEDEQTDNQAEDSSLTLVIIICAVIAVVVAGAVVVLLVLKKKQPSTETSEDTPDTKEE